MRFNNVGVMLPGKVIEMFQQLTLRYDGLWPVHQVLQDSVFHWGKIDQISLHANSLFSQIKCQRTQGEERLFQALAAPDQSTCPRYQLPKIERFRHVVVRSEIEEVDRASCLSHSSQDKDGSSVFPQTQPAKYLLSGQFRDHEVEYNKVVRRCLTKQQSLFAFVRKVDGIARALTHGESDVFCEPGLVFDHQD